MTANGGHDDTICWLLFEQQFRAASFTTPDGVDFSFLAMLSSCSAAGIEAESTPRLSHPRKQSSTVARPSLLWHLMLSTSCMWYFKLWLLCLIYIYKRVRYILRVYSCRQKSAYIHLHLCDLEHCCASQTDTWTSVTIPSGSTQPTLQPQLFRFLLTLARFKLPAKDGISCWQKADAVNCNVIRNLGLNSCIFSAQRCAVCYVSSCKWLD